MIPISGGDCVENYTFKINLSILKYTIYSVILINSM